MKGFHKFGGGASKWRAVRRSELLARQAHARSNAPPPTLSLPLCSVLSCLHSLRPRGWLLARACKRLRAATRLLAWQPRICIQREPNGPRKLTGPPVRLPFVCSRRQVRATWRAGFARLPQRARAEFVLCRRFGQIRGKRQVVACANFSTPPLLRIEATKSSSSGALSLSRLAEVDGWAPS